MRPRLALLPVVLIACSDVDLVPPIVPALPPAVAVTSDRFEIVDSREGMADTCTTAVSAAPDQWPDSSCTESLCVPDRWVVEIHTVVDKAMPCHTALAQRCATQQDEGDFFYRVSDVATSAEFELGFSKNLGDGFSDEALARTFGRARLIVPFALGSTPAIRHTLDRSLTRDDFDTFEFVGGRFRGTVQLTADSLTYDLSKADARCRLGDIVLNCTCTFPALSLPVQLTIDVALEPTF